MSPCHACGLRNSELSHVRMYATGGRWPSGREDRAGSLENGTKPSGGWVESVVFFNHRGQPC